MKFTDTSRRSSYRFSIRTKHGMVGVGTPGDLCHWNFCPKIVGHVYMH